MYQLVRDGRQKENQRETVEWKTTRCEMKWRSWRGRWTTENNNEEKREMSQTFKKWEDEEIEKRETDDWEVGDEWLLRRGGDERRTRKRNWEDTTRNGRNSRCTHTLGKVEADHVGTTIVDALWDVTTASGKPRSETIGRCWEWPMSVKV